ncbi:UTRA domain-containing protein [Balneatrix alpica]|uniref:UTRA domain-containing protein n=1 Tax=Balneatrix alpica TaxID=75684 RepID=UPI0027389959|nr:UTRA domain-containing protein [Balneatrix alpica]
MATEKNTPLGSSSGSQPLYLRLRDQLWQWIEQQSGDSQFRLPAERELAERFATTRVTLRQALSQLEGEGRIYRSNRRGWFLTPARLQYDPNKDTGFHHYVQEQGLAPRTETLQKSLIETPSWLAALSGLAPGAPVYQILRRRYVDERAVLVEHNYLNPALCPGLLNQSTDLSIFTLLKERYQLQPAQRQLSMYAQALTGQEAEALGVSPGCAGLFIQRLSLDQQGRFLELDQEYWLHDALTVVVQVTG